MNPRSTPWLGAVLLVGLVAAAPGHAQRAQEAVDLREWIDGPIRYLARKDEVRGFRDLESEGARALFIEQFWARRDPTPLSWSNEYRQLFWQRVNEANGAFTDSSKSGWRTDRGKIHILYGPPTDVQEDIHLKTDDSIVGGGFGVIRWLYEGRPGGRRDLDAVTVVAFVRDGSGEYRVTYDPTLTSVFFDPHAIRTAKYDIGSRIRAESVGAGRSELSVMLDLGKLQEVPPEEQVLLERVEVSEAYDAELVDVAVEQYQHPDAGAPLLVINVDLSRTSAEARPAIIARLAPAGAPDEPRMLGEESFRLQEVAGERVAQGRMVVSPGSYLLTVMVADPVEVRTGLHRVAIDIAPPSDRLRFSDLVLASRLEPLPYRSLATYDEPFIVGPFEVVPKLAPVVQRGEDVSLFYEIYSARAPFEVSYQLEGLDLDGSWVKLGEPSVAEQHSVSQGWAVPTHPRWPLGEYRVRIDVRDSEGRLISAQVPFTLAAAPGES